MARVDEKIFRIYLDAVEELARLGRYDSYESLEYFIKKLDTISEVSGPAQKYQSMIKDYIQRDPRVQRRLVF